MEGLHKEEGKRTSLVEKGEISTKNVICVYKEGTKREQYWGMEGCYKRGTIPQITAVFDTFLLDPSKLPVLVVTFRQ